MAQTLVSKCFSFSEIHLHGMWMRFSTLDSFTAADDGYCSSGVPGDKISIKIRRKLSPKKGDIRLRFEKPSPFHSKWLYCHVFFRPCYRVSEFSIHNCLLSRKETATWLFHSDEMSTTPFILNLSVPKTNPPIG